MPQLSAPAGAHPTGRKLPLVRLEPGQVQVAAIKVSFTGEALCRAERFLGMSVIQIRGDDFEYLRDPCLLSGTLPVQKDDGLPMRRVRCCLYDRACLIRVVRQDGHDGNRPHFARSGEKEDRLSGLMNERKHGG